MGGACSMNGGEKKCIEDIGGKVRNQEAMVSASACAVIFVAPSLIAEEGASVTPSMPPNCVQNKSHVSDFKQSTESFRLPSLRKLPETLSILRSMVMTTATFLWRLVLR
jgi:hypothetical protein